MESMSNDGYLPIENHGIIGDLHTVALVGTDGSIDFMSYPHFGSSTIFASLLDAENGGRFQLRPCHASGAVKQMYLPDTNVLITRTLDRDGVAEVSDFMPVGTDEHEHCHALVRRAKRSPGGVVLRRHLRSPLRLRTRRPQGRRARGRDPLPFRGLRRQDRPAPVAGAARGEERRRRREVRAPCRRDRRLRHGAGRARGPEPVGVSALRGRSVFKDTVNYWRTWIGRSQYHGRWRETVNRSALVLKLLVSDAYGSLVAAPTFGLPEELGGERNWDYRYTWIRDASFTLYALIRLGYTAEAGAFMRWIEDRCNDLEPDGSLQIMYGIDGHKDLTEEITPEPRGVRRLVAGAHRQRRLRPAPARHLRRAHGLGVSLQQVRRRRSRTTYGSTSSASWTG